MERLRCNAEADAVDLRALLQLGYIRIFIHVDADAGQG